LGYIERQARFHGVLRRGEEGTKENKKYKSTQGDIFTPTPTVQSYTRKQV